MMKPRPNVVRLRPSGTKVYPVRGKRWSRTEKTLENQGSVRDVRDVRGFSGKSPQKLEDVGTGPGAACDYVSVFTDLISTPDVPDVPDTDKHFNGSPLSGVDASSRTPRTETAPWTEYGFWAPRVRKADDPRHALLEWAMAAGGEVVTNEPVRVLLPSDTKHGIALLDMKRIGRDLGVEVTVRPRDGAWRAVASPDALSDEAELVVRGESRP